MDSMVKNGRIKSLDGDVFYYKDGVQIRTDKDENGLTFPAFEGADGAKYWYENGELHRMDGPAVIDASGECVVYKWLEY